MPPGGREPRELPPTAGSLAFIISPLRRGCGEPHRVVALCWGLLHSPPCAPMLPCPYPLTPDEGRPLSQMTKVVYVYLARVTAFPEMRRLPYEGADRHPCPKALCSLRTQPGPRPPHLLGCPAPPGPGGGPRLPCQALYLL